MAAAFRRPPATTIRRPATPPGRSTTAAGRPPLPTGRPSVRPAAPLSDRPPVCPSGRPSVGPSAPGRLIGESTWPQAPVRRPTRCSRRSAGARPACGVYARRVSPHSTPSPSASRDRVPHALLPAELAGPDRAGRRTARDWTVDVLLFGWAVLWWVILFVANQDYDYLPDWLRVVDPILGGALCVALWWRRRFPLAVSLAAVPAVALSNTVFGAGMVILLNLAMRVQWRYAVPVLVLYLVASAPYVAIYLFPHGDGWASVFFVLAYNLVFFAWGAAIRARRQLIAKLREDAERERVEHARRLADTRRAERAAIAREMHDVLAHRISLLSVHAGALAYRTRQSAAGAGAALSDTEVAESAQVIRDNAHQALEELREVLHVLRAEERRAAGADPDAAPAIAPPQPT
ncbi:hypothetical protein FNX44_025865, partial [Streptomyces sp. OF1]|nr:hypothetical protein [Streptomyces alkaliterrae]